MDSNAGTTAFYMQQDLAAPIIDHAVAEAVSGPQIAHAVYDNGSRIRIVRRIADVAGTDMQGSEAGTLGREVLRAYAVGPDTYKGRILTIRVNDPSVAISTRLTSNPR